MMNQQHITRTPFPNSKKVYASGQIHDIRVAMREIKISDPDDFFSKNYCL